MCLLIIMKKLIIDFDSTLVKIEALDMLAERALQGNRSKDEIVKEIKKITELGMNGDIGFSESLDRRIKLIQTTKEVVAEVGENIKNEISDSVLENLDFFKKNKENIYIISGGFRDLIFPTAKILGISEKNILANDFVFDLEQNLIGINKNNLMSQDSGKVKQLKRLKLEGKLIMVGDGWTDYQTKEFGIVDKFIAYTENVTRDKVVSKADIVVDNFDQVINYFDDQMTLDCI